MLNQVRSLYYPGTFTTFYRNGKTVSGLGTAYGRLEVASGPVIHGDKKRPNPWSFNVLVTQPFTGTLDRFEISPGAQPRLPGDIVETLATGTSWIGYSPQAPLIGFSSELAVEAYNRALSELLSKLRDNAGLNLAVDVAEIRQTVAMLGGVKKFLGRISNGPILNGRKRMLNGEPWYKKSKQNGGNWAKVPRKEVAQMPANAWLSYVYGWSPLFSSIYGTFHQAVTHKISEPQRLVGKATEKSESVGYTGISGLEAQLELKDERSFRCKIVCDYELQSSALQSIARFTTLNPISIAWELVPYSFVVDWFVNIGGVLEDLETAWLYANQFRGGYVTKTGKVELTSSVHSVETYYPSGRTWVAIASGEGYSRRVSLLRTVLTAQPQVGRPQFRVRMGSKRILSAAALIAQKIIR